MKRSMRLTVLLLASTATLWSQPDTVTLAQGQTKTLTVCNSVAVFSRDSSVVRASIVDDEITLQGVAPGNTEITVVTHQEKTIVNVRCCGQTASAGVRRPPATTEKTSDAPVDSNATLPNAVAAKSVPLAPSQPVQTAERMTSPPPPQNRAPLAVIPDQSELGAHVAASLHGTETLRMLSIRELRQAGLPDSHATAAYSLDPLIAEAQVIDGQVRIWGRAPGKALIMLVNPDFSTNSILVTVTQAPPILPDQPWNGLNSDVTSKGFYEIRVSSNPLQIGDSFDYRTGRVRLHLTNAIVLGNPAFGTDSTRFPFSYFTLLGDRWRLTLVDQAVDSSTISVSSTLVRGAHFSVGGLSVHAGYTSVAGFQSLFLPARKQLIAGATYAHHLGPDSQIGVTGYFLEHNALALDPGAAQGVATVFFRRHPLLGSEFAAEMGVSHGIGGALSFAHNTDISRFHLAARYRPRHYAASETDNLNGLQAETRWDRTWGKHFVSAASGSANHIFTRTGAQTIEVATGDLRYKASREVSLSLGSTVSRFTGDHAQISGIRRFAVPMTIAYDRQHFGVGAQYEYSRTTKAFSSGQAYRGNLRWSVGHLQMNANAGLDTQALGLDTVFSAFPELNAELARRGLGAGASIDQLAALLRDRTLLNGLGLAPGATLQLVPRNWHGGVNLSWRTGRQALEVDSNHNLNSFLAQKSSTTFHTIRYRRGILGSMELGASASLLQSFTPLRRWSPVWEFGVRQQLGAHPFSRLHEHKGEISGIVQLQDSSGRRPLSSVEITLDGNRKTTSDSQGHYRFARVPQGPHNVEIKFKSARSFWYTTPSKVTVLASSIVDFGIIFPSAQVVGYALNDAGVGLPEIGILVKGPEGELNLTTDQAGKFFVPVAQTGAYIFRVNTETVPDGYALEDLASDNILVGEGEFKKVTFKLPAIRALTGLVQAYNPAKGEYAPLAGATVELAELKRRTTTDSKGHYSFRNMTPGVFTIRVNGQQYGEVSFGLGPQLLHQDIKLNPAALAAARH
jgi:hypothetical protein